MVYKINLTYSQHFLHYGGGEINEIEMEDKMINEQESLELITRMINQTKKESALGSGNIFLVWGYLCTFMSLCVFGLSFIRQESGWGWLYLILPLLGFTIAGIVAGRTSKKYKNPATYQSKSISGVWASLSGVFAAYAVFCLLSWNEPKGWAGMFLLGLLLPGIGTFSTGIILKEWSLQLCGMIGAITGVEFLHELCVNGAVITIKWPLMMAVTLFITLAIPGHILNYKSKKDNA